MIRILTADDHATARHGLHKFREHAVKKNKMRFEIVVGAAQRAGFKAGLHLLKPARIVI